MSDPWGDATRAELWRIIQEQGAELKRLNDEGTAPENARIRALEDQTKKQMARAEKTEAALAEHHAAGSWFCSICRAAGRDSGGEDSPQVRAGETRMSPAGPVVAAAKSAARFQDELRDAIEREARDG